ncbi:hypothetical protein [Natrinema salaciae]|uniref:hypothetical protein n=1 Tax=Natrinema salaciae TaxID=1186196 RepID=UPI000B8451B4|nr:hypothetical protein [Natrinema salaciae]
MWREWTERAAIDGSGRQQATPVSRTTGESSAGTRLERTPRRDRDAASGEITVEEIRLRDEY